MVSNKGTGSSELSVKLNQLEDKVAQLNNQIKLDKQTISELKLLVSQRDAHIQELDLKLGYAQQSLLTKAANIIQECRSQLKTGIDERVINPTITQIQQNIKIVQEFVDETKTILMEKKVLLDSAILATKDKAVQCPEQAKAYVENSIIAPAQFVINQTLDRISTQVQSTRNLVENKAIYPGKVLCDEFVRTAKNLTDKIKSQFQAQVFSPLAASTKKASSIDDGIYPNTLEFLRKTIGCFGDIANQALFEIGDQVKKSSFWNGKNSLKASS